MDADMIYVCVGGSVYEVFTALISVYSVNVRDEAVDHRTCLDVCTLSCSNVCMSASKTHGKTSQTSYIFFKLIHYVVTLWQEKSLHEIFIYYVTKILFWKKHLVLQKKGIICRLHEIVIRNSDFDRKSFELNQIETAKVNDHFYYLKIYTKIQENTDNKSQVL